MRKILHQCVIHRIKHWYGHYRSLELQKIHLSCTLGWILQNLNTTIAATHSKVWICLYSCSVLQAIHFNTILKSAFIRRLKHFSLWGLSRTICFRKWENVQGCSPNIKCHHVTWGCTCVIFGVKTFPRVSDSNCLYLRLWELCLCLNVIL